MIYELRIYTIRPGIMAKYLDIVGNVGMKIRGNDYGKLVGTWSSEFGQLNEYYHLWEYPEPERADAAAWRAPEGPPGRPSTSRRLAAWCWPSATPS